MNNPKHLVPPTLGDRSTPLGASHSSSDPKSGIDGQAEYSTAPQVPFLAWSRSRDITESTTSPEGIDAHERSPASLPRGDHRDLGLWLLHDAFVRRARWARLTEELIAAPFGSRSSIRPGKETAKRACDLVGATIVLLLCFPVLILVSALIRLDSPGPAIFRQRRVGKNGHEFLLWKFRSMQIDVAPYAPSPTTNLDLRLTRIGRLIRRISIDELPQLVNVLRGEMSLVGPRPEMPFIVDRYTASQRRRLAVKPGITGLWQISPARALPIHENLQYDLHYIQNRNFILDGAILLRTIGAVIRGVGAV